MIEISNLTKTYQMGDVRVEALRGVTLTIEPGEFVAIMGPSGSGKSTLMHVLGLLDSPSSGSYRLQGEEVSHLTGDALSTLRSRTIGFIFQQFNLLQRTSALDNVALPLQYSSTTVRRATPACRTGRSEAGRRTSDAETLLAQVGLSDRMHHKPNELSGGQQQRVAIARAMVNHPAILFADEPTGNLDSTSEKEIMKLLLDLNAQGVTLVLVTHEEEIGALARRVIRMRDGVVVSDEKMTRREERGEKKTPLNLSPLTPLSSSSNMSPFHNLIGYTRQAWISLAANKVRSGLSMLGILIGVAAVIAMLALGRGAKEAVEKSLSSLGSNLLILMSGGRRSGAVMMQAGSVTRFTPEDGQFLLERVPGITAVNPTATGRGQIVFGNKNWNTQVVGVTPAYEDLRGYKPALGRFFTEQENHQRARVVLLGDKPYRELFGNASPIGEYVKINRVPFQVIGVFPVKGASGWRDQDDLIVVPVETAMRRLLGKTHVDYIDLQVASPDQMEDVQDRVRELIIQKLRLPPSLEDSFDIRNLAEIQAAVSASSKVMSMLLSVVAAISLLVGGIGIMNIMLVSVTERTREIGLRKAVGARRKDILAQFLVEAATTSLLGGILGILLGVSISLGLATFANWTVKIGLDSILISTLFSATVGIIFGLWPARKAAALDPITALRYE